ncbi:MAG: ABC transporter permease [Bacteroidales bacterium]|nr:ABC transporter permease [Bacteroidales bacterium]
MKKEQRKTAFYIALRYLFSKKQHNIINVISLVSMLGIMVCAAALIVVLSVFNGMEQTIGGWFNAFNPDFEITLVEGKSFPVDSFPKEKLAALPEVAAVDEVVSDMVLTTYNDRQELLRLKGVSKEYIERKGFDNLLIDGTFDLYRGGQPCAVVGNIAAGTLQLNLRSYDLMKVYYPKRTKKNLANPTDAFTTQFLYPTGVFNTNTTHDQNHVFCSIDFVRDLMLYEGEVTSVEIQLKDPAKYRKCQDKIQHIVGPSYRVKNKYQQEETLFKTMQSEKLVIYVILAFILLISAFNIIGSLGILILEKREDTSVMRSMGASNSLLQRVFVYEGILTSCAGGAVGMALGAIICLIQQVFHVVKLGGGSGNYIIPYYPVQMQFTDFLWVGVTILAISLLTSLIPALALRKASLKNNRL